MIQQIITSDHTNKPVKVSELISFSSVVLRLLIILLETNHSRRLKLHLPDYFHGVHAFFHEIDKPTLQRLTRFLYTYVSKTERFRA